MSRPLICRSRAGRPVAAACCRAVSTPRLSCGQRDDRQLFSSLASPSGLREISAISLVRFSLPSTRIQLDVVRIHDQLPRRSADTEYVQPPAACAQSECGVRGGAVLVDVEPRRAAPGPRSARDALDAPKQELHHRREFGTSCKCDSRHGRRRGQERRQRETRAGTSHMLNDRDGPLSFTADMARPRTSRSRLTHRRPSRQDHKGPPLQPLRRAIEVDETGRRDR